jgi:hypothetical protein
MDIREAMAVLAYKVKEAKGNGRKVSKEAEEAEIEVLLNHYHDDSWVIYRP